MENEQSMRADGTPTRRQFGLWLGGAALGLTGCGGGGSDADVPPVTIEPQLEPQRFSEGLALVAGALGGPGALPGEGISSRFTRPEGLAAATDGVWYVAANRVVWKVDANGRALPLLPYPHAAMTFYMACNSQGVLHWCSTNDGVIYRLVEQGQQLEWQVWVGVSALYPNGGLVDGLGQTARFRLPGHVVFDTADNLYVLDKGNRAIRRVSPGGLVTTLAGNPDNTDLQDGVGAQAGFASPVAMTLLLDGRLLVLDGRRWRVVTRSGAVYSTGELAPEMPSMAVMVAMDATAVVGVVGNSLVKVQIAGGSSLVAGEANGSGFAEGAGASARFDQPSALVRTPSGKVRLADYGNHVIRDVDVATGQSMEVWGSAARVGWIDGRGGQARFSWAGPTCTDSLFNLYLLDSANGCVRKVTPDGQVSTVVRDFPSDGGLALGPDGVFYGVRNHTIIKVFQDGRQVVFAGSNGVPGAQDGRGEAARFGRPLALVLDAQGHLLVGDAPTKTVPPHHSIYWVPEPPLLNYGGAIRRISPSGDVVTLTGTPWRGESSGSSEMGEKLQRAFLAPDTILLDRSGNIHIKDCEAKLIRSYDAAGAVRFAVPVSEEPVFGGLALDRDGVSYLLPLGNKVVRLARDGSVHVIAGSSEQTVAGEVCGVSLGALPGALNKPTGLVSAGDNHVYVFSEKAVLTIGLPAT